MNLDPLSFSLSQINFLITNLNKRNFKSSQSEIQSILTESIASSSSSAYETERHLFRFLLSNIDFNAATLSTASTGSSTVDNNSSKPSTTVTNNNSSTGTSTVTSSSGTGTGKDHHQVQLLRDYVCAYLAKPNFATLLCYCIDNPLQFQEPVKYPANLAAQLSKLLKLNQLQEIGLAVCLKESNKDEIRKTSNDLLKQKLPELLESFPDFVKESENNEISVDLLQNILIEIEKLYQSNQQERQTQTTSSSNTLLNPNQIPDYSELIKKLFKDSTNIPDIIKPYLIENKNFNSNKQPENPSEAKNFPAIDLKLLKMENTAIGLIHEIGYSFTSNPEDCRNALTSIFNETNISSLNPTCVARIISMMVRTHNSGIIQNDNIHEENINTWNLDVFVLTVQDIVPSLSWKEVIRELDNPDFFVKDKSSLRLLVQALKKVIKEPFPIDYLYRVWKNTEGQISWINNSLKYPDIFCFADYPYRRTATECLKAQPEDENRLICSWRSLNLIEVLLQLSDAGSYSNCVELFKFPISHCPDLLLLGLLQLTNVWNKLKQELTGALITIFLGNHPNSAVILQHAWNQTCNTQQIRIIIMNAMTDWYMKAQDADQNLRLARILDVSQDLKALSMLLNGQPLIFNIDLACLAARRGYLKLDKWLSDRIRDHGELFISTVVAFLKRKIPSLGNSSSGYNKDTTPHTQMILLPEMVQTIVKCISASSNIVSAELSQEIFQINVQSRLLLDQKPGVNNTSSQVSTPAGIGNLASSAAQSAAATAVVKNMVGVGGAPSLQPGVASSQQQPQGAFDIIQSMFNLNMNASMGGPNPVNFGNSPGKLILSQLSSGQLNPNQLNLTSTLTNLNNQNILLAAQNQNNSTAKLFGETQANSGNPSIGSGIEQTKLNVLNSLFGNQAAVRSLNYGNNATGGAAGGATAMRSNLNSPQLNLAQTPIDLLDIAKSAADQQLQQQQHSDYYSKEIEEEVNKCIQSVFKSVISVEDFASILFKLKDSQDKKDKDFYTYALKYIIEGNTCLFQLDEMQFHTMSNIWGVLIERNVLSPTMLSYCLKILHSMLNKPISSKNFLFVAKVLDRCKTRLKDFVNFCQCLIQLPNYQELPRLIKEYIEYGARGSLPPNYSTLTPPLLGQMPNIGQVNPAQLGLGNKFMSTNPSGPSLSSLAQQPPGSAAAAAAAAAVAAAQLRSHTSPGGIPGGGSVASQAKPSIANTTNIETLLVANENDSTHVKPVAPSESIQDKISFIFNNLSLMNMQPKGDELRDAVKEEYWDWVAHYLVVKRVSIEPNFHTLYSQFIDVLRKDNLCDAVLAETYRNIKVLLRSDKNDHKFGDRALLKNLGSWLGLITLAKNKPILHRDIDLKSLICEAFQKGQVELLFVVPFVAKVLEPAGKSKIFQPPNPWVMSMLSILVELHNEPDLKLNHKFEIEVLCKNLSLNINEISVKGTLRSWVVTEEQLTKLVKEPVAATVNTTPQQALPSHISSGLAQQNIQSTSGLQMSSLNTNVQQQTETGESIQQSSIPSAPAAAAQTAYPTAVQTAKYKLSDIKLQGLANNSNLIYINSDIPLLTAQPALKNCVIPALEKAVNDMIQVLLDKAVKISVSTAEPIIKKDFALDPEENHMRIAARNMVANMSSGMMLITGKEPLGVHLFNTLRAQFTAPLTPEIAHAYKDLINQACGVLVQDNIELCMCFLQKIAIQRSIIELENKLKLEFDSRLLARREGRAHYDPAVLAYHLEKMPENIRLRVGPVNQHQFSVYEEFGRNLPGFKSNADERAPSATPVGPQPQVSGSVATIGAQVQQPNFTQVAEEMNAHYENQIAILRNDVNIMPSGHILTLNLHNLMIAVHDFKVSQQPTSAFNLIKKLVHNLFEGYTLIQNEQAQAGGVIDQLFIKYRESNLSLLKVILGDQRFLINNWILKEVQKIWLDCNPEFKYSIEAIAVLFKYKLLSPQTVDVHLAQFVDSGHVKALQIAQNFLRYFYIENASSFLDIQLPQLLESVSRISAVSRVAQQNSELKDTIEVIRMNYETGLDAEAGIAPVTISSQIAQNRICATALSMMYTGVQQARDFEDPQGLKEKSEHLLHEWIQHHAILPQRDNTKPFQQFVLQMNSQGLFKTDDMITRFFRICTESCVESCYLYIAKGQRQACYQRLDAFVKLIILLVKHSGDQINHVNKINLFNKVLGLISGCLLYDQETKVAQFEPMPYHRLFHMLLFEAMQPENNLEPILYHILQAFVNVYHIIRPTKAPGFAYAWLELVAHRIFISKMLNVPGAVDSQQQQVSYKTWNMYATLLCQLIKFLAPFLRNIELNPSIMHYYKGTLRLFLVLLHDFPEFLCNSHYAFCDVIPSNCIQLRNLVLSAFPRCMKLPDPLTPNLKVDMIADIDSSPPKIAYPYIYNIPLKLKLDLESYIKTRSPIAFLSELRSYLQSSPDPGSHYNIQLMNALVMYVGTNGIQALRAKGLTPTHNNLAHAAHSAHSDIFQNLVADLDSEGRYLFINAIANQLRFPNSHTHYFGCALLNLFSEANTEAIQEQITRVLLERLIVNRPHPWGLLVTFIELIKNPQFKFWNHQFVRCAPEIEKMFMSLGKNCIKSN